MPITQIKKRNGLVAPFDRAKIENAMSKAFAATQTAFTSDELRIAADEIVAELETRFVESIPGIEDIQDVVERKLAEGGYFEVAKAYIIYRRERAAEREEEKIRLLERIEKSAIKVKKRDGNIVRFSMSEIERAVKNIARQFANIDFDVNGILQDCKVGIYDGISTKEINQVVLMSMKSRIERDPTYSNAAALFLINDLYKDVLGVDDSSADFDKLYREKFVSGVKYGIVDQRLDERLGKVDLEKLAAALVPTRDHLLEFMGAQTLYDRYFLRDHKQKHFEVPQHFWMRVALGMALCEEKIEEQAINFYNAMSQLYYVPSTPTLLHSGTIKPQMSSCYLSTVEDDLHHIFKCVGDNAQLSKWSGGIGQDWTNIRATNALVKSINVVSQGVIPYLKIVDSTTAAINRSGKRRGATAVYLETWHMDIEEFVELRKNTGDDRRRTHDTNTANWIPDLFMKRVIADGEWTLFSPEEVPELHHIYGKKFEEKYAEYEAKADRGEIALFKRIKAADLWRKMITMLFETGHPWMTFKDPANLRSPQDHAGVIHNSNLCTEITLNTSAEETAVCNLGSVNFVRHFEDGRINWERMSETVQIAVRMLDNVITLGFYPTKEAETSNFRHRPVGLGVMGYQDLLYKVGLRFDSDAAVELSDELMEFISLNAIFGSSKLAKERGTYSSYKGSKWDRNIFPVDTIEILEAERGMSTGVDRTSRLDWTVVRDHVKQYGMRNSNVMAIAPTATIANISGCLPSIEPIYKNLYVKSNFSGEFTIINRYLVEDLKKINLWNQNIVDKLKFYEGSVQRIYEIPADIRAKYQEVFELDAHWIIKHAAYRGKWIDQSQSVNIFTSTESGKHIASVYMDAWQSGLKTTYYLRTLAATSIEKSTLDINKDYSSPSAPTGSEKDVMGVEIETASVATSQTHPTASSHNGQVAGATMASAEVATAAVSFAEPQAELASAHTLTQNLEAAVARTEAREAEADRPIMSAARIMHIAEDGLCESCQ
jgi:ribonucleoside-diphosphate reductase alpha chain